MNTTTSRQDLERFCYMLSVREFEKRHAKSRKKKKQKRRKKPQEWRGKRKENKNKKLSRVGRMSGVV